MVGKTGFEPATAWSQTKSSTKLSHFPIYNGAPDRNWTHNLLVRSQTLYPIELRAHTYLPIRMWYIIKWWLRAESNCRHRDFQSLALPTELQSQLKMAVSTGIEPAIFCVTGRRDNRYTTRPLWLREEDLNLWPSGYEPNELPNCSIPRYKKIK